MPPTVPPGISCIACGYDLRTLAPDAACPECAHPIAFSVRGDLLRFAPHAWVQRIERGLTFHHALMRLALRATLLALCWMAFSNTLGYRASIDALRAGGVTIALVTGLITAFAAQRFGAFPPASPSPKDRLRPRVLLRICSVIYLAGVLATAWAMFRLPSLVVTLPEAAAAVRIALQVNAITLLVSLVVVLESIHKRTSDWKGPQTVKQYFGAMALVALAILMMAVAWLRDGIAGLDWGAGTVALALLVMYDLTGRVRRAVADELSAAHNRETA